MTKIIIVFILSFIQSVANPITFKDYGAIWVCDNYYIYAQAGAKTVDISNEPLKLDKKLRYDNKSGLYISNDGKTTLQYSGSNLEASRVIFNINGEPHKCYYEYMENG